MGNIGARTASRGILVARSAGMFSRLRSIVKFKKQAIPIIAGDDCKSPKSCFPRGGIGDPLLAGHKGTTEGDAAAGR